jgi:hypothetical protein
MNTSKTKPPQHPVPGLRRAWILAGVLCLLLVLALALVVWLGQDPWEAFAYEGFN